ncbi:MAG: Obg family GTPase CgtA [Parcubacteria bacterium C7867-005]|nr:MAG: Obg family GTPase CgtA [Parcubacteria bacterium C7867-005]
MFVDDITLHLKAGKGGDGVERWLHEKGKDHGGPSGGNGGKGGDVFAVAARDIGVLSSYKQVKNFEAGDGEAGMNNTWQGGAGEDIHIKFPVGSRITNQTTGHVFELVEDGQSIKLLSGGRGGLGNEHFKSSTNVRPTENTPGKEGEEADFHIEVLLVVDFGIIGLPNAGKSSLLNSITRARSKIGDFPFTTLEPSLGDLYGIIIGDIPGLIEGAAEGKGLGHKFLRHIERTKGLIHCISSEETNVLDAYRVVRKELELYNKDIISKPEIILLTKVDLISTAEQEEKIKALKTVSDDVFPISVIDDKLIKSFKDNLSSRISK